MTTIKLAFASAFFALTGCTASTDTAAGSAPTIANVAWDKTEVSAGKTETLSSAITVTDADGDASSFVISVSMPGGASQALAPQALQNIDGKTAQAGKVALMLGLPAAGSYTVSIWVLDRAGNKSNVISTPFTAK